MKTQKTNDVIYLLRKNKNVINISNGIDDEFDIQNGGNAKFPLLCNGYQAEYKTFTDYYFDRNALKNGISNEIKWYEVLLATTVMVLGIGATLIAAYSNWSDAFSSANFTPPCLINATAAARNFLQISKGI